MMKLLVIGTPYDVHMRTFIGHLKSALKGLSIDLISTEEYRTGFPGIDTTNNIWYKTRHFWPFFYKIPKVQSILAALDFRISLKCIRRERYDIINIHYISIDHAFCYHFYRKRCTALISAPYGSDILRAPWFNKILIKSLIKKSDYLCGVGTELTSVIQTKFKVPDSKFVDVSFGSDVIDRIAGSSLSKDDAKRMLSITDKTIITIGYNASPRQNHLQVYQSVLALPEEIKKGIVVIFPLTYPHDEEYIKSIKTFTSKFNVDTLFFESFLSLDMLLVIRKASDIYINAQTTDASSASLKEYLLSNNIVLNASWLKYPQLENYGPPYTIFNSYEELSSLLFKVIQSRCFFTVEPPLKDFLLRQGWKYQRTLWAELFNEVLK